MKWTRNKRFLLNKRVRDGESLIISLLLYHHGVNDKMSARCISRTKVVPRIYSSLALSKDIFYIKKENIYGLQKYTVIA